jgi:serine protease Do
MNNLKVFLPTALAISLFAASLTSIPKEPQQDILAQASRALHDIAHKATPAVVSITSVKGADLQANAIIAPPSLGGDEGDPSDQMMLGVGSGVIVRPDGLILTNNHVVQNAERVTVSFDEKSKISAHVVGGDTKTDLAVIKLDKPPRTNLPVLTFGDSDQLQVGDWTLAVGSPYGLSQSVTSGIVSAVGRGRLGMLDIEDFIQTDAAINPGNSGGPLLNSSGEMIGINTAIFSQSGGFSGIGFAVPSKIAKKVYTEIVQHGRVIRGWIGMMAQDLDEDLAKYFKVSAKRGALISEIQSGSPAAQASLKIGDVIVQYGGNKISSASQLKSLVAETKSTTRVPIQIYREGKMKEYNVLIREQPAPKSFHSLQRAGRTAKSHPGSSPSNLGLVVQDIPPEIAQLLEKSLSSGALVTGVKAGSPAFEAGLGIGDIILNANQHEIQNAKDFSEAMKGLKDSDLTVLYVQRGPDEKVFVPVKQVVE